MRTVLFGLDGATFTVLDPLMADGVMPNLRRFCDEGARCELASTPMPVTPQAWTSLATGRGAGSHGIHDFIRCEQGPNGIYFRVNDSRDNHCETIWQYVSRQGKSVTVLNYFGLAPPARINGHSMPGFVSGRHLRRSSYPQDLFERLSGAAECDVHVLGLDLEVERQGLQDMAPERWSEWIRHHIRREQAWSSVLLHLMRKEPSDLTAIVLDGVDKIQHLAYRFLDPAWTPAEPTPWEAEVIALCRQYFGVVDDMLGQVMELVGADGRIVIASDHGFTATTEVVYINKWLQEEGFLAWREEEELDEQNSIFSERLASLAGNIDLERTQAYALTPSCNGIFIHPNCEDREKTKQALIERLQEFRAPDGGKVVTEIKPREEWFPGPF
ncbi:MAG: alkaline phosphatase family protein, partial [Planctomycetales bacterium]|nr:alkaline phosphatase family protein [Planctomycetales bacterium]